MNDITALIESLKEPAKQAIELGHIKNYAKGRHAVLLFQSRATAANVLALVEALVEALEKALATEAHSSRGWNEAHEQEARADAAEKRIVELEESHAQVIQSRDHYKRMSEEGLKQIQESRTVTVKSLTPEVCNALKAEGLADVLRDAAEYGPLTAEQWVTLTKNWHQTFIGLSGDAAGIQVIEGEE